MGISSSRVAGMSRSNIGPDVAVCLLWRQETLSTKMPTGQRNLLGNRGFIGLLWELSWKQRNVSTGCLQEKTHRTRTQCFLWYTIMLSLVVRWRVTLFHHKVCTTYPLLAATKKSFSQNLDKKQASSWSTYASGTTNSNTRQHNATY